MAETHLDVSGARRFASFFLGCDYGSIMRGANSERLRSGRSDKFVRASGDVKWICGCTEYGGRRGVMQGQGRDRG